MNHKKKIFTSLISLLYILVSCSCNGGDNCIDPPAPVAQSIKNSGFEDIDSQANLPKAWTVVEKIKVLQVLLLVVLPVKTAC